MRLRPQVLRNRGGHAADWAALTVAGLEFQGLGRGFGAGPFCCSKGIPRENLDLGRVCKSLFHK